MRSSLPLYVSVLICIYRRLPINYSCISLLRSLISLERSFFFAIMSLMVSTYIVDKIKQLHIDSYIGYFVFTHGCSWRV